MSQVKVLPAVLDDNGKEVVSPTLHHTGNQTRRMDEMLAWYRNVLGQQVTLEGVPPQTFVPSKWTTNDHAHHRMGFLDFPTVEVDTVFSHSTPGVQHTAWEYDTIDDLLESWERLTELGIRPVFTVTHGFSFAFYYRDPDENLVELLADAFGDPARSLDLMNDPRVKANPGGIPVDPAQMLAARRNGLSLEELRERAYAGEYAPPGAKNHALRDDQIIKGE